MVYVNEWFPDPVGPDASGEFIELYNSGPAAVSLSGYALGTGARKTFALDGISVPAGGYLALPRAVTGLSLKNTSGAVFLYGPDGTIVDGARFIGPAEAGKSFSRMDYGAGPVAHFAFAWPTPGAANRIADTAVLARTYPYGASLTRQPSLIDTILLAAGVGTFFFLFFLYATKNNRNISYILFGRDETARP